MVGNDFRTTITPRTPKDLSIVDNNSYNNVEKDHFPELSKNVQDSETDRLSNAEENFEIAVHVIIVISKQNSKVFL